MQQSRREELEARLREVLREHQHEGLHMIGGADQLVTRLLRAIEEWEAGTSLERKKTA
jgi:hypothetical protein